MNPFFSTQVTMSDISDKLIPRDEDYRAFYQNLFLEQKNQKILDACRNKDQIRMRFEMESELEFFSVLEVCTQQSYQLFFDTYPRYKNITQYLGFLYSPSIKMKDSSLDFYLGVDKFGFGWNLIGRSIESCLYNPEVLVDSKIIYLIHHAIDFLLYQIYQGIDISKYIGKSCLEIVHVTDEFWEDEEKIQSIFKSYLDKKLPYCHLYEMEMKYPKNLVIMIYKEIGPSYHAVLDKKIKWLCYLDFRSQYTSHCDKTFLHFNEIEGPLLDRISSLYQKEIIKFEKDDDKITMDRLLLAKNKIPDILPWLANKPQNIFRYYDQQRKIIILSENNEPISPLASCVLSYDGFTFPSILHMIYYKLLVKMMSSKKLAYSKIFKKNEGYFDFRKANMDGIIYSILVEKQNKIIKSLFCKKITNHLSVIQYMATKSLDVTTISIPNDVVFSKAYHHFLSNICKSTPKSFVCDMITNYDEKNILILSEVYQDMHSLFYRCRDKWGMCLDEKNIKTIVKISYPVLYNIYKINYKNNSYTSGIFSSDLDASTNHFLSKLFHLLSNKIQIQQGLLRPLQIIKKICLFRHLCGCKPSLFYQHIIEVLYNKPRAIDSLPTVKSRKEWVETCKTLKIKDKQEIDYIHRITDTILYFSNMEIISKAA